MSVKTHTYTPGMIQPWNGGAGDCLHLLDLPNNLYHSDLLDSANKVKGGGLPLLSASRATTFYNSSPGKMIFDWKKSNNEEDDESDIKYRIGSAAHSAILREDNWEESLSIVACENWRSKAHQQERADAVALGFTPLNLTEKSLINDMRQAWLRSKLSQKLMPEAGSFVESSIFWNDSEFDCPITYKVRPDYLPSAERLAKGHPAIDYKTAADLGRWEKDSVYGFGLDIRVALYVEGIKAFMGGDFDDIRYAFLVQEKTAPYNLVAWVLDFTPGSDDEIGKNILDNGQERLKRIRHDWQACMEDDRWPYPQEIRTFTMSGRGASEDKPLTLSKVQAEIAANLRFASSETEND